MDNSNSSIKQVIELPFDQVQSLFLDQKKILSALENMKVIEPSEYLTAKDFMSRTSMGRWKFNKLREENKIQVVQRGLKLYIKATEVTRFFNGEME